MKKEAPGFTSIEEQQYALEKSYLQCLMNGATDLSAQNATASDTCPSIWDGIACWPATAAGFLSSQKCPSYIAGFEYQYEATRQCMDDGQWFVPEGSNNSWTNYSMCYSDPLATVVVRLSDVANASHFMPWMPALKKMKQVGYSFSLLSLIVALCILASSKRLRCPRNTLHMHLFVSFILRAFMALLKDSLFVEGVGLSSDVIVKDGQSYFSQQQHNWVCKCVTSIWQFCIMANYSWILMEGLYLHNLIFMAMFTDSSAITLYVILGWGLPVFVVVPWVALRAVFEDNLCWTTNQFRSLYFLIIMPIILSNLINFVLFLNIVRVLFLKLRSSICEETRRYRYRKWGRSTLVLMPLFGVHYTLFLCMTIGENPKFEVWGLFFDQLFASFQGFFVAVLYCFLNSEVRTEMEKKWRQWRSSSCGGANGMAMERVATNVAEAGPRRRATNGTSARGGLFARRQRRSASPCTSNCTMLDSAARRLEPTPCTPLCPSSGTSTVVLRRASDHVFCCSNMTDKGEAGDNNPASERLLHCSQSALDDDGPVLEMCVLKP